MAKATKAPDDQEVAEEGGGDVAPAPQAASKPRLGLVTDLEGRSKQALAVGDYAAHAALDRLVGAAHYLKSNAQRAIGAVKDDDADLVTTLLGLL